MTGMLGQGHGARRPRGGVVSPGGIRKGFGEDRPLESRLEGVWDFSGQREGCKVAKSPRVYGGSEIGRREQQEGDRDKTGKTLTLALGV